MAMNDLAESAFGGLTAQLETFGRIGIAHAAVVSDIERSCYLVRPTTKKDIDNSKVSKSLAFELKFNQDSHRIIQTLPYSR